VRRTVEFIRPVVGARIEIVMAFACDSYLINADPNQFETALINVAANARDAMAGEGRIEIRIEPTAQIPGASAEGSGSFAAISITDQGTGIDPKNIEHIFEPFFTTKEVGKGTGLGLSQVYGFVKQSGGDVRIESKLNVGTTITLYLPQANSGLAPAVKNVTDPDEQKRLATRGRILVVEDNREVGTFATQLLSDLGYTTTWVESAREALSLFEGGQCHFDLVFSDVVMPGGMSGVDLANELRRRMPTLPVVLTSGYSETLAEGQGANFELLRKPYSVESLSGLIRKALQDGRNPEAEPR
jgi:CheY-like chemotaxis protein/anti-sigma regulatory factor (Ser/Thr protein kinase)